MASSRVSIPRRQSSSSTVFYDLVSEGAQHHFHPISLITWADPDSKKGTAQGCEYQDQEGSLKIILEAGQEPGGKSPMGLVLRFFYYVFWREGLDSKQLVLGLLKR